MSDEACLPGCERKGKSGEPQIMTKYAYDQLQKENERRRQLQHLNTDPKTITRKTDDDPNLCTLQ
jgi:hypothetical protein